jgi:hypothetical protein
MKKILLYTLLLSLLSLTFCTEDPVTEEVTQSKKSAEGSLQTTAAAVTGLTRFRVSELGIPSTGLRDGTKFCKDLLRGNVAYYPYSIKTEIRDGVPKVRFYVKPTSPTYCLVGTAYPYHYRAEVCRFPWKISHPAGTEEWIGFSYTFPTKEEGFSQNQTPVSIFQNHDGISGPPAVQLEIAYPGQLKSYSRYYYNTPLGGEIMIINNVRGIRWVAEGVRVVPGGRLDIIIQLVYGTGTKGLFNVWINGKLQTWPGSSTVPAGNIGGTIFPTVGVGGNSKLGLYHHQMRFPEGVQKNYAKGHTHMRMWMGDWNDVIRKPTDWDYKSTNAYSAVNTASYP